MGNGFSNEHIKSIINRRRKKMDEYEKRHSYGQELGETEEVLHQTMFEDTGLSIWINVNGKAEKVLLDTDWSPAQQRTMIANHFGLSPAVRINIRDYYGNVLDKNRPLDANREMFPYHIQCEMTIPPEINTNSQMENGTLAFESSADKVETLEEIDWSKERKIVDTTGIDVWSYSTKELLRFLEFMFYDLGIIEELEIELSTLRNWLIAVEHNYRTIPFHNFRHAFSVTHMMYFVIRECDLTSILSTLQIGVLLVACISHDLDHPGLNNTYQIKANTDISLLYRNCSPLEHHHCAVAFQLLSFDNLNIFKNLSEEVMEAVTTIMINLILATDLALHSEILEEFLKKVKDGFRTDDPEHSLSLQKILIKCCDISNEVRPLELSEPWVDRLLEEFFCQGDQERQQGYQVAQFMERGKVHKPHNQLKFIRSTLLPLFVGLSNVLPSLKNIIFKSIRESECHYERMCDDEKDDQPEDD